jgi:nucleotide-binding universal stress UspA family protein
VKSLRVVLVPLFGSGVDAECLDAALAVAGRFGAHVDGLFVRIDPLDAIPVIGEGVSPAIIDQLTHAAAAEMDRQSAAARSAFEAACGKAGVALATDAPGPEGKASAGWMELTGRRDELIPRQARASDLVVLRRPGYGTPPELHSVLEATLFGAGRPLLMIPPGDARAFGQSIAIAWNGSTEVARAVAGALPFVDAARVVHLLTAETWRTPADVGRDLAVYLAWRGVACEPRTVAGGEDEAVGAALLRTAAEVGADLMVMGGYGRTRFSELVLGGVTRHVLGAAELPVLASH